MPVRAFDDSEREEIAPVVQAILELSADTWDSDRISAPLVIERIPDAFRRRAGYIPEALRSAQQQNAGPSIAELEAAEKARNNVYGLNRSTIADDTSRTEHSNGSHSQSVIEGPLPKESLTDTERAVQELLNPHQSEVDHLIQRTAGNELFSKLDAHPDMSSLEDYEAIPVEAFGLAMLRGMGYDPAKEAAKGKTKEKTRRPDFLGLGATERPEESKTAEELAKKKFQKRKEDRIYVPVVKINKRTGEVVKEGDQEGSRSIDSKREEGTGMEFSSGPTEVKTERMHREDSKIDAGRNGRRSKHGGSTSDRDHRDRSAQRSRDRYQARDDRHRHRSRSPRRERSRDRRPTQSRRNDSSRRHDSQDNWSNNQENRRTRR